MIEKLRDEIIESQKARTELMKWKLILVAAIGGASLGIGSNCRRSVTRPMDYSASFHGSAFTWTPSAFTSSFGSWPLADSSAWAVTGRCRGLIARKYE